MEDHLVHIKHQIENFAPNRIAVDSISALERISTVRGFREFVLALTSFIKHKEITGLFVVKDGVAKFVPVRTGIASETMIEVFGDVKEGDEVVGGPYKALRELKPGGKVKREGAAKGKK